FVAEAARPLADCVAHRVAALAEEAGDARVPPERRRRAAERRARLAGDGARLVRLVETLRGLDGARTPAGHVRALGRVLRDLGLRPVPRGALLPATTPRDVRAGERLEEALDQLAGLGRALGMAPLPLGGLFRTAREASLEDPFLFFLALSMAERELVLSYPETNEQGNPTVPSPFLDEVQATAAGPLPRTALEATALVPPGEECCEL